MKGLVAAAGLLAMTLTACAPPAPQSPASPAPASQGAQSGPVKLVAWGWNQTAPWKDSVEAFNKANSDVQIEYRGYKADEYNKILQTGLSGSSGPDIVMLRSYGGLESVVASGLVAPIGDEVSGLADFSQAIRDGATSQADGKTYGVPFAIQTANIQYNKKIFADHGLSEPKTWDEFIQINEKLSAAGVTPMAATVKDSWILPIIRDIFGASAYGGPAFAKELLAGRAKFTDERYIKANQVVLDLKKYFPKGVDGMSYADSQTLFASGKAAMFPGGIWDLNGFRKQNPDLDIGIFNAPRVDGSTEAPYAMGYVDGSWGMSAKIPAEKRAGALKFLAWTAAPEYGQIVADSWLQIPCVPGVTPKDEELSKAGKWFSENPVSYLTYVNFDYGTPPGTDLEYNSLQKMFLGRETPADVAKDLDEGISQWFKPKQ